MLNFDAYLQLTITDVIKSGKEGKLGRELSDLISDVNTRPDTIKERLEPVLMNMFSETHCYGLYKGLTYGTRLLSAASGILLVAASLAEKNLNYLYLACIAIAVSSASIMLSREIECSRIDRLNAFERAYNLTDFQKYLQQP